MLKREKMVRQKVEVNLESRSDTMVCGRPCRRMMLSKKRRAVSAAVADWKVGIKCARLVNLSMTTRIISNPRRGMAGKGPAKSMEMVCHRDGGAGRGIRRPEGGWLEALLR